MRITTTAFVPGGSIPANFTKEGADKSPLIRWDDLPSGTRSLAMLVEDLDSPGEPFVHWLIYDIPADTPELEPEIPRDEIFEHGIKQGRNSFDEIGYSGPLPPPGKRHQYVFRLFALSVEPGALKPGMRKNDLFAAIRDKILAQVEIAAFYKGLRKARKAV